MDKKDLYKFLDELECNIDEGTITPEDMWKLADGVLQYNKLRRTNYDPYEEVVNYLDAKEKDNEKSI